MTQETASPLRVIQVLGAVATGILVVLSFPLFGSTLGIDWFVWFAFVPLILASWRAGLRRGLALGAAAGLVIEGAGFVWILVAIRNFTALPGVVCSAVFLLWVAYSALPWAAFGGALSACRSPWGLLGAVGFWIGLEHYYPRVFPWQLGVALHDRPWLLQTADLWGGSGLSGLILPGNVSLALIAMRCFGRVRGPWPIVAGTAVLLVASLAYGRARLEAIERLEAEAPRLRFALLQGALDPRDRAAKAFNVYQDATRELLSHETVDLVVWPEGAVSGEDILGFDLAPEANREALRRAKRKHPELREAGSLLVGLAEELRTPIVAGGSGFDVSRRLAFSNVLAYARPGARVLFYEKNYRVPFGEVNPLVELLPDPLRESLGLVHVGTIAAGRTNPLAELGPYRFRGLICYEATLPGYFARSATGAQFLVNITEDAWYGRTAHVPQHASVLKLRVVENRIPLLRAANMGPSGVFGIPGRMAHATGIFRQDRAVGELRVIALPTVYRSWGRHLPLVALLGSALGATLRLPPRFARKRR